MNLNNVRGRLPLIISAFSKARYVFWSGLSAPSRLAFTYSTFEPKRLLAKDHVTHHQYCHLIAVKHNRE